MIEALEVAGLGEVDTPFGTHEEEAIALLMIDHPEFFGNIIAHLTVEMFKRAEVQYIVAVIINYHADYNVFPSRGMLKDLITKNLTVDDAYTEDILNIVDKQSNPRDVPAIKANLLQWARYKAYDILFAKETIERFHRKDYDYIEEVFAKARRIQEVGSKSLWFWDQLEALFANSEHDHFTTGIYQLNKHLDDGGPSRKEVLVIMAPTGVGKCHTIDTKIIEKRLSCIYEIELDDGKAIKLAGFREIQTMRGKIKVCDLTEADDIIEIPAEGDAWDISL